MRNRYRHAIEQASPRWREVDATVLRERAVNFDLYTRRSRYPDLHAKYCAAGRCDTRALHEHFRDHGRREGRRFGCVNISAAERAKYPSPALSPRTHRFDPRAIIGIGGPPRQESIQTTDRCRNERTNTVTLSLPDFCFNGGESEGDLLHNLIERNIAPYVDQVFRNKGVVKDQFTVVVMPSIVLCRRKEQVNRRDITLTTQMSINKITRLVAIAGRWNGPVSVAMRVSRMEEVRLFTDQLVKYREQLDKVAFHLYFEDGSRSYPNNILRNVALDGVKSDYFAVFDVDLLPSPVNTHQHLQAAFDRHPQLEAKLNDKTVFVLPAWEVDDIIPDENITIRHSLYPETKHMVVEWNAKKGKNRKVRIFRSAVFEPGQRSTDYPKWISNNTDVSYPIVIKEFGYEPYIIGAKKGVPHFFREFRGYGFNKLSFYTELHYASYKLEVLRDFFIFHVNHVSTYGKVREHLRRINQACVAKFLSYLSRKYDAGSLRKHKEVKGWDTWMLKKRQGQGYNVRTICASLRRAGTVCR